MRGKDRKVNWESVFQILAVVLALGFYGGLFIWIDIQEYGSFSAIFQDEERMLTKILLTIARFVR